MSKKNTKNFFIDDEAELSEEDIDKVSDDEVELSDDDTDDENLVAKGIDAEVDSEEDEKVRNLFHKQQDNEDRRQVLILQEQLEDRDIGIGQRRRKKFRWQTSTLMDRLHNDEESDDGDDDGITDDDIANMSAPRLRRPPSKFISFGTTAIEASNSNSQSSLTTKASTSSAAVLSNDTRSQTSSSVTASINKYVYRDRETVAALSKEQVTFGPLSKEEREKVVQRELKKVLQSKSIFDALFD